MSERFLSIRMTVCHSDCVHFDLNRDGVTGKCSEVEKNMPGWLQPSTFELYATGEIGQLTGFSDTNLIMSADCPLFVPRDPEDLHNRAERLIQLEKAAVRQEGEVQ